MELIRDVVLFAHLLGFGALFGGAIVQLRDPVKVINSVMLIGVLAQVVSGIVLVGVLEGLDEPIDTVKVAVKFGVGLVVAVLCWVNRSKREVPTGLFGGIVLLTLAEAGIAVFW